MIVIFYRMIYYALKSGLTNGWWFINTVENVQWHAAWFVVSDYGFSSSVTGILNRLRWSSLDVRRQVNRLMIVYKILQGSVALDLPHEVSLYLTLLATRGHDRCYQYHSQKLTLINLVSSH